MPHASRRAGTVCTSPPALLIMIFMQSSPRHPQDPSPPTPHALGRRSLLRAGGVSALGLALAACGSSGSGADGKPLVVVGCYGLEYMATLVAGDAAEVWNLAQPGSEPHSLELSVAEAAKVAQAAVIVQIPGFQSAVDDVISAKSLGDITLDVSTVVEMLPAAGGHDHAGAEGHDDAASDAGEGEHSEGHGATDPHMWTDPTLLATVATALGERLAAQDEAHADAIRERATKAVEILTALDEDLRATYDAVTDPKVFVTSHTAFAYMAHRYGLEQVGITGIDPETEPSPQRLLQLRTVIEEKQVSTVCFEVNASPKVAETLAERAGVTADSLDNLETRLDPDKDYAQVMREDAAKLVATWS